jgi:hypothetical protein
MSDADRHKPRFEQAAQEFGELAEWEQAYLNRRLIELGRPIANPEAPVGDLDNGPAVTSNS